MWSQLVTLCDRFTHCKHWSIVRHQTSIPGRQILSMACLVCGCDSGCCTFPRTPNNGCRIRQNAQRLPATGRPLQVKTQGKLMENDWLSTHRHGRHWETFGKTKTHEKVALLGEVGVHLLWNPVKKGLSLCDSKSSLNFACFIISIMNHIFLINYMLNTLDSLEALRCHQNKYGSSGLALWLLQLWVLVTSKYATYIGLEPIRKGFNVLQRICTLQRCWFPTLKPNQGLEKKHSGSLHWTLSLILLITIETTMTLITTQIIRNYLSKGTPERVRYFHPIPAYHVYVTPKPVPAIACDTSSASTCEVQRKEEDIKGLNMFKCIYIDAFLGCI